MKMINQKKRSGSEPRLYIGTSGWNYSDWVGKLYPDNLPRRDWLKHYSENFRTVELNYSFYRLPRSGDYISWKNSTPEGFLFSVKTSRFITHVKRLNNVAFPWGLFIEKALLLKEKLGPVLVQFPENFKENETNLKRLEQFLKMITERGNLRFAFEFRNRSFFNQTMYDFFREYGVALVFADSPEYPRVEAVTADFMYVRMHGSGELFSSRYSSEELRGLAKRVKGWLESGLDVYVYFNNDSKGNAVDNAKELMAILGGRKG